jgi:hypothetical protein
MLFEIPVIVVLLQSIPEGFFIVLVGLKLFNIDIKYSRALVISFSYGIFSYIIRRVVFIFGLHTFLSILILILLVKILRKISIFNAIISVLVGSLLAGIFQVITAPLVLNIIDIEFQQLADNPGINIIASLPTLILLGLSYYLLSITGFYLFNVNLSKKD